MGVVRGLDSELSICAPPGVFLIREEINSILLICKSFKIHFSRKCPNRVFDSIVSILCKIPWQVSGSVSTPQRDHLFEMIKVRGVDTVIQRKDIPLCL